MSKVYITILNDTFVSIARKMYGDDTQSDKIAQANPGILEPLNSGIKLFIPDLQDSPQNLQQQTLANTQDEVSILIDGIRFRFWDSVTITRNIDSMDTVEFSAPFDSNNLEFREMFRPCSFKQIVIMVGGNPLFTGVIININPVLENEQRIVSVSGYALPGVLNDCTASANSLPLEFNDQGLKDIATKLAAQFGISISFTANQGAIFERVALDAKKKVLAFLIELAKQRNLILSSTARGKLLFRKSVSTGNPVAQLKQGLSPVISIAPLFNPQQYYSHITGIESASIGFLGSQHTVKNPHLENVLRPLIFDVSDTKDSDVKTTVQAKMGRMFGNVVGYSVKLNTWHTPNGKLWESNKTIILNAPDVMIYNDYEFIIRSIRFERNKSTKIAILELVMPGAFSGEIPEVLPWDE